MNNGKGRNLDKVHAAFRHWLGKEYDLAVIDAVLAAAAVEQLDGDPLWLLVIAAPGAAKTETVTPLAGAGAHVISTIASEGALLSGSPKKSRTKDATGGLLKKIGEHGILVVKDFTSILSAARETRGQVLAAIREIYDGVYVRNVGTDGGHTLDWRGRIIIIGACTNTWDMAHAVVATMGDRFCLIRIDSKDSKVRLAANRQAIRNTGKEVEMRNQLAEVVGNLLQHLGEEDVTLSEKEATKLEKCAEITTMARTAVERGYNGDVINAHEPEMPTRFTKQLMQAVRGGVAIGLTRTEAMKLAMRIAKDSIPPLRLEIILDIAPNPDSRPGEVCRRINKPWTTVKREMEALCMIGILDVEVQEGETDEDGRTHRKWMYALAESFRHDTLLEMAGIDPETGGYETPHRKVVTPVDNAKSDDPPNNGHARRF